MALIKTINVPVVTTGYTAIPVPTDDFPEIQYVSFWTEDGTDYYLAEDDSGTGEIPIKGGLKIGQRFAKPLRFGSGEVTICHIKGTTNTNIIGVVA